jgi:hypothetical protein
VHLLGAMPACAGDDRRRRHGGHEHVVDRGAERGRPGAAAIPASGSPPSVSASITRASAMPSAMLRWIRTSVAQQARSRR